MMQIGISPWASISFRDSPWLNSNPTLSDNSPMSPMLLLTIPFPILSPTLTASFGSAPYLPGSPFDNQPRRLLPNPSGSQLHRPPRLLHNPSDNLKRSLLHSPSDNQRHNLLANNLHNLQAA